MNDVDNENKNTRRYVESVVGNFSARHFMRANRNGLLLLAALMPCMVSVVGWIFVLDAMKIGLNGQHMDFPTALWLGMTILFAAPIVLDWPAKFTQKMGVGGLFVSAIFGLATLIQSALGADFIPNIAVKAPFGADSILHFLIVPIDISFCLLATSAAGLALFFSGQRRPLVFQSISLLIALPASFLVVADLFGAADKIDVICAYQNCVRLEYLNYVCLLLLNLAILFARPAIGITSFLGNDTAGNRQIKTSLAGILLMIPILWIFFTAARHGVINEPAMIVLSLISAFITIFALIAYNARSLDKIDREKQATEQSLNELNAQPKLNVSYRMLCLECFKEYPGDTTICPDDSSSLSRLMDNLAPGTVLGEKYEILDVIGFGGMSTVYKAKHLYLETVVAVKVLNHQLASDTNAVRRFQVEARAAHGMNHPNVMAVTDFGISQTGQAYIVMDYLEGRSLADLIQVLKTIPLDRALRLFIDICRGLDHAHRCGVIHRDIKPSNIMLITDAEGRESAKIVDFGLAKVFDEKSPKLTQTGEVYGSPLYMSPEQCRGVAVDHKTDIYSLGVLMYETLAGVAPITGTNAYDTFTAKMALKPQPFAPSLTVPQDIEWLIRECLSVETKLRPASTDAIARRIKRTMDAVKA
ncbi:MAG: serine/threonine protein kinase [Cyanobacteria bacterium REEB67]|nr:serine/threonine protein kinase [Cyanobacteria bacterium REEB67]